MDETPTDLPSENLDDHEATLETTPETKENIQQSISTSLSTKLKIRRIFSLVGSVAGLGVVAYTLNAYARCPGGECAVSWFGQVWYILGAYIFLFSAAGFVTTSKSYLNTQKRSIIGVVSGGIVFLAIIVCLFFIINSFIQYIAGDILNFVIIPCIIWTLIALPLLSVWLYTLLKSLRFERRVRLLFIILLTVVVALSFFGITKYFTSPEYIKDTKNDQQFSKVRGTISYANRYKMVGDFIDAINESDADRASSFYYPLQKGSDVMPDVEQLIESRNKYLKNDDHKYAIIDYTKQKCMVDSIGNHYYYSVRLNTHDTSPYVIDINLVNENKTKLWYMMSRFYTAHADIKTSVCQ